MFRGLFDIRAFFLNHWNIVRLFIMVDSETTCVDLLHCKLKLGFMVKTSQGLCSKRRYYCSSVNVSPCLRVSLHEVVEILQCWHPLLSQSPDLAPSPEAPHALWNQWLAPGEWVDFSDWAQQWKTRHIQLRLTWSWSKYIPKSEKMTKNRSSTPRTKIWRQPPQTGYRLKKTTSEVPGRQNLPTWGESQRFLHDSDEKFPEKPL